jgi:hypothetical protein
LFACPVDIYFVKEVGTILSPSPVCLIRQATWIAFILTAFLVPAFLAAQTPPVTKVLIYYNSSSPIASVEPMTVVTNILTIAGAQVTSIDVASSSYCPTGDNWGDYNQVWDLRCQNYSSSTCPQVYPDLDTFMACWQTKSISYLQSGGNLYLAGEYNGFNRKNTGISDLLITIGAVKAGYTDCPGVNGNGLDVSTALLACNIPGQSGPTSYSGRAMGGIPISYLNGSNFVSDPNVADWGDGVDRSIVSGWLGGAGQMVNLTGNVGNLVTTWDNNGLSFSGLSAAEQTANTVFVKSVYCFLGGGACATNVVTSTPTFSPTPTLTMTSTVTSSWTPTATPISTSTYTATSTVSFTPTPTFSPTPTLTMTSTVTSSSTPTATPISTSTYTATSTVSFTPTYTPTPSITVTSTPISTATPSFHLWPNPFDQSVAVRGTLKAGYFPDGILEVYSVSGESVTRQSAQNGWMEWDGRSLSGRPCSAGIYYYVVRHGKDTAVKGVLIIKKDGS